MVGVAAALAALSWGVLLVLPWMPWRTRERLVPVRGETTDLGDITALVPARDEGPRIAATLAALAAQGRGLAVVLVDDESSDDTAARALECGIPDLTVVRGKPLPAGWSGKVWAQHQGEAHLVRALTLLVDADIELAPGTVAALRARLDQRGAGMVSVLAAPCFESRWARLLMPAFVFFFRLLYPFALANRARARTAAAAGGCVLLRTEALRAAGGFGAIRDALIDDCALARRVKDAGYPIWIGLTHAARSRRPVAGLGDLWRVVTRTAFTQLRYSPWRLLACTVAMLVAFAAPLAALAVPSPPVRLLGATALICATFAYLPTLRYYRLGGAWALGLVVAAGLFLAMTWASAAGYWNGRRSVWRGRVYRRDARPR